MQENDSIIDKWTALHALVGYMARKYDVKFSTFLLLIIAYEVFEYSIEYPDGSEFFGTIRPESIKNIISDLCTGILFYYIGGK